MSGPLEWIFSLFAPLIDVLGLDTDWLALMAGNIIAITSFTKRWWEKQKWGVWALAGGFGLMYAGTQYWGDWPALIGATVILVVGTAGMLYMTGKGGKVAKKMVPLGAGKK